jgi:acetyltransferase
MKNGQEVTIRPIRAEDEPLMVRFHQTLSDRSVYLRYFQKLKLSTRTSHDRLVRVCFLDYDREFALLAERKDVSSGQGEVIAIATLTKIPYKNDGEVAVLISDAYHGQGLGKELIARIVGIARDEGLGSVSATTMVQNEGMCAVFERLGFRITIEPEDQLVEAKLLL